MSQVSRKVDGRKRKRQLSHFLLPIVVACADCGADGVDVPAALASVGKTANHISGETGHGGHKQVIRKATLSSGQGTPYRIKYWACTDQAHAPKVDPYDGPIGMPNPSWSNWYFNNFLRIFINGEHVGEAPLSSMTVAESGQRAIIDLVWHHKTASVRMRLAAMDTGLFTEIAIDPKQEITAIKLQAICWPSVVNTSGEQVMRKIQTPTSIVQQGETIEGDPSEHWWLFFYDEIFDFAKGRGEGPCGLVFMPEDVIDFKTVCGARDTHIHIGYNPSVRRVLLAFWDFNSQPNGPLLESMPDLAQKARARLASFDFTPEKLKRFDLAAADAQIEAFAESAVVRDELGSELVRVNGDMQRVRQTQLDVGGSVNAVESLLQFIERYEDFYWRAKLAELLAF